MFPRPSWLAGIAASLAEPVVCGTFGCMARAKFFSFSFLESSYS